MFQKCEVLNVRITAGHGPAQAQEEPAGWGAFPVFVWKSICKIESKFLNSRVLAGGFVMGCVKKSWFVYKKVVEKSAV